jgi:hypothetical protein
MISDRDIWLSAKAMIDRYGSDAGIEAARRADTVRRTVLAVDPTAASEVNHQNGHKPSLYALTSQGAPPLCPEEVCTRPVAGTTRSPSRNRIVSASISTIRTAAYGTSQPNQRK